MKISMETIAKLLIVAGLVQRFGALKVGLYMLGVAFVMAVIASVIQSYKIHQAKAMLAGFGTRYTH